MYTARNSRNRKNVSLLFDKGEGLYFVVLDVETTGKKDNVDYVVEFSAIKYQIVNHEAVETDQIDVFMKPPFLMDQDVINVHGITNEFLADQPSEEDVIDYIRNFLGPNPIMAAYNGEFDLGFMQAMYKRCGYEFTPQVLLDVIDMARDLVDSEHYDLGTITKLYKLEDGIRFHSSIDDCRATARLMFAFKNEYEKQEEIKPNRETIIVNYSYFWGGFNKSQTGIYFDTNFGRIWLNTVFKRWCSTSVDLSNLDIDSFEKGVCQRAGLSFNELARMTEKKFKKLKGEYKI